MKLEIHLSEKFSVARNGELKNFTGTPWKETFIIKRIKKDTILKKLILLMEEEFISAEEVDLITIDGRQVDFDLSCISG